MPCLHTIYEHPAKAWGDTVLLFGNAGPGIPLGPGLKEVESGQMVNKACRSHFLRQREICETKTLLCKCQLVPCPSIPTFLSLIILMEAATLKCPHHEDEERKGLSACESHHTACQPCLAWLSSHPPCLSPSRHSKSPEVLWVSRQLPVASFCSQIKTRPLRSLYLSFN